MLQKYCLYMLKCGFRKYFLIHNATDENRIEHIQVYAPVDLCYVSIHLFE